MVGSGNLIRIFSITGETPTIAKDATPVWESALIEKNDLAGHPNANNVVLTVDNLKNDDKTGKFIKDYLSADSSSSPTEVTLEDNTIVSTSTSSGVDPTLVAVVYFGVDGNYRQTFIGPVKLTSNTGNISTSGNNFTRRTFEVSFIKATKAITLPSKTVANVVADTFYPTTHVVLPETTASAMPAVATVPVGTSCVECWLPKGSKAV